MNQKAENRCFYRFSTRIALGSSEFLALRSAGNAFLLGACVIAACQEV